MRLRGAQLRPRRAVLLGLLVVFGAAAAALGAYLDWQWWMPYEGVAVTLGVGALFLLALVLATVPRARTLALVVAVAGLGLLAGQNLGPARPELRHSEGTIKVALRAPTVSTGEHLATCASNVDSGELHVAGDSNLRIEILPDQSGTPADVDQREMLGISVTVGDRWEQGPRPRSDQVFVSLFVGSVYADAGYTILVSGPDSALDLRWTEQAGSLAFSGLHAEDATQDGEALEALSGTAEWTCG